MKYKKLFFLYIFAKIIAPVGIENTIPKNKKLWKL